MKNGLCLLLLTLCFPTLLFCQTLRGGVYDRQGKSLSDVNISLLTINDSSQVSGTTTDRSGRFIIKTPTPPPFILSASAIGYQTAYVRIKKRTDSLPGIVLERLSVTLKEVQVSGKKPFIEQRIDRMIVNVAGGIISSGSTALEILQKIPGVTVDQQNDLLRLRGKEGVIVQIDGKQTYVPLEQVVAMLRNMPGGNIDRIEVITNPSAKYDAAGNAGIIDIRLKKNNNTGTNGSASASGGGGRYDRQRTSIQLNHKTSKINLYTNYGASRGGDYWDFNLQRVQTDGAQKNYVQQLSPIRFRNSGHNARAGLDIQAGESTTLGLGWTGIWNRRNEQSPARAFFRSDPGDDPYLETITDKNISNRTSNQLANLNVQHSLNKDRGQITADIDAGRFTRHFLNSLSTATAVPASPPEPVTALVSQMHTTIDIFTFRTDYNRTYKGGWALQSGWKSSVVLSANNMELSRGETGNLRYDSALSNNFRYKETIHALYVNGSGKWDSLTEVQVGLRLEQTLSDANSLTQQKRVKRNYLNFFPSVFVNRQLSKLHTLTFSYSHRIYRPNYQNLNPVRSYLDPYAFGKGNAFLTPDYTHSFELKHGYKAKIYTSVGASLTRNLIFFIVRPIDSKTTERTPENIGRLQEYNITLMFPVTVVKGWAMQYTAIATYSRFRYLYLDSMYKVRQFSGRLNVSNTFTFGKGWTGELTGWVTTPGIEALYRYPWQSSADVGIQKVLNTAFKLKLTVSDIFHSDFVSARIRTPSFSSNVRIRFDTRVALLNLTYTFGNQQLKSSRPRKSGSEDEIKRLSGQ